ncbi:hypothetical protein ACFXTI_003428 [Malus domestica]
MSKAGYDFASSSNPGKKVLNTVNNKERDLTETQKKLKKHGYGINNNKAGLGFTPNAPVKISSKAKNASTQHISVNIEQDREEPKSTPQTPIFDRIKCSRPRMSALDHIGGQNRTSVFKRLNRPTSRSSIFERLSKPNKQSTTASSPPRQSALERLEDNTKFSGNRETTSKEEKLDRLAEKGDIRSSIPSRMKRQAILEVDANGPLIDDTKEEVQDVFHITIQEGKQDETPEEDVTAAPPQLEDGGQATVDDLKELNLGTKEEQKPIFVSALLRTDEIDEYYQLLSEYKDVFAWTYKEMPGLDPVIAAEIDKLIEAGFIREDDFPLPIIEIMVDATTGHEALSFMDGSSGYNQIRMALEDEELTAFRTPKGIYCYKVMPFGLKNAGATYQRAMQKIFNDMLHKNIECYVDDVVVKTKKRLDHLKDLRVVFERLRKYNLKMNPLKCAFGVTSGKFLGFVVKQRGIDVDQ